MTAFAVFVGQKHWFLQCFCTLPKLEFFAHKCKKTSQIAVLLATMVLNTLQIAMFLIADSRFKKHCK